jgi:RNA polymerase sigma-70 factor (ECF subfamily)
MLNVLATPDYASTPQSDHLLSLYTQHADTARALASRLVFDRSEAEDIVHEVFLGFYVRPACFDPERGTSRAWLLTAVRNRSLDHLRRRPGKRHHDLSELAERLPDPQAPDLLDALELNTRRSELWQAVNSLPAAQADLIRRAFVSGQTHQQIAADTGLPLGTVKSRIRLGLEKLRAILGQTATLEDVAC